MESHLPDNPYESAQDFLSQMDSGLLDGKFATEVQKLSPGQIKEITEIHVQMNTQIPLVRIDRTAYGVNLVDHFVAGWELVSNAPLHEHRELVFGVVLTGPDKGSLREILLWGMLAPEGSLSSPQGAHPVPGFMNSCDSVELLLEKPLVR
jgi:hypothetical protein